MRKNRNNEQIRFLRHQMVFLKIDLENVKRFGEECKRQKNDWRTAAKRLAGIFQRQKYIPQEARRIIKNFPKC